MRSLSITLKVFGALTVCIAAAAATFVGLAERSYRENVRAGADQAITTAQRTFRNVQSSEVSKLGATLTALMADDHMRELYLQRDRTGLYEYAKPLYADLNAHYAVTNWHFMDVQPQMFIFLRLHDPANHSEVFWHQTAVNSIQSHALASGMELGKFGFALRVVGPYQDKQGKVIGYMEVAEDIGRFAATMKAQTGDDYALVAKKSLLDRKSYETSAQRRQERNSWDDLPGELVLGSTTGSTALAHFDGADIASIPAAGQFLQEIKEGGRVWVRGAFPLVDVSQKQIGGVFVQHDITALHAQLQTARNSALVTIITLLVVLGGVLAVILRTLIFARIERTMAAATRVVGGDFATPIVTTSDDEVGRLEMLLEAFRQVFVTSVTDYEQRLTALTEREADVEAGAASGAHRPGASSTGEHAIEP